MEVNGPGPVGVTPPLNLARQPARIEQTSPQALTMAPRDEVDISSVGKMLDDLNRTNSELRQERLAQIKTAIENGTYDTDEKLELALDRMFQQFGNERDT